MKQSGPPGWDGRRANDPAQENTGLIQKASEQIIGKKIENRKWDFIIGIWNVQERLRIQLMEIERYKMKYVALQEVR